MIACARVSALLDVYLDGETSAETNALIQHHLESCSRCGRELHLLRALKSAVHDSLIDEQASAQLQARVSDAIADRPRGSIAAAIRAWFVPASAAATVLVALMVLNQAASAKAQVEPAIREHLLCALNGPVDRVAHLSGVRYTSSMPWVPDPDQRVRIADAHHCGREREYSHLMLEGDGARASILISERRNGDMRRSDVVVIDGFDVTVVASDHYVAYVVIESDRRASMNAWRQPAVRRIQKFLQQLEES